MTSQEFKTFVYQLAQEIGVSHRISSIHLRKMKTKIASCSSKGRLSFDPDILGLPFERRKEIIIHELLHLRYPNHGKMFKLLAKFYENHISKL